MFSGHWFILIMDNTGVLLIDGLRGGTVPVTEKPQSSWYAGESERQETSPYFFYGVPNLLVVRENPNLPPPRQSGSNHSGRPNQTAKSSSKIKDKKSNASKREMTKYSEPSFSLYIFKEKPYNHYFLIIAQLKIIGGGQGEDGGQRWC